MDSVDLDAMNDLEDLARAPRPSNPEAEPAEARLVPRAESNPHDSPLVPRGGAFEGQVAITGPTRIEGSVRGSVRGVGDLFVGGQARIEGRVECEALESEGEIIGPVSVRTRACFGAGARLDGDLEAPVVVLADDAIWNGRATVGGTRLDPSETGSS